MASVGVGSGFTLSDSCCFSTLADILRDILLKFGFSRANAAKFSTRQSSASFGPSLCHSCPTTTPDRRFGLFSSLVNFLK
jgi:hypothetical protein